MDRELKARILESARKKGRKLSREQLRKVAKLATTPPLWVVNTDHWMDVVVRGTGNGPHDNYAGAIAHFRASCKKHGIPEPFAMLAHPGVIAKQVTNMLRKAA